MTREQERYRLGREQGIKWGSQEVVHVHAYNKQDTREHMDKHSTIKHLDPIDQCIKSSQYQLEMRGASLT